MAGAGHLAFIALGSNLESPRDQVLRAFAELEALPGTAEVRRSSLYQTDPVGLLDQPAFTNAVAALKTALDPDLLLWKLREIEAMHGRSRSVPNGPRTLDLDLLLYDDLTFNSPALTLPHPRMQDRAFVLVPLAELSPHLVIPGVGPVSQRLAVVGQQGVTRLP